MPHAPKPDADLVSKIEASVASGESFDTPLDTDERVLARVTDGIYRQPGSALRELIANAYDADATIVSITTDAPRFSKIKVRDNGMGMTPEALANLVLHIGGSAKRTLRGPAIGLASNDDPSRSPKGRRLIGKIGIGLFSVAQLTRQFTIVTKTKGSSFQLLAHVTLNRFDENELGQVTAEGLHVFHAGQARIWAEKTPDTKGHGTTVRLTTLLPRVVHILQSRDVWRAIRDEKAAGARVARLPPLFHVGEVDPSDPGTLHQTAQLPWKDGTSKDSRFRELVVAVARAYQKDDLYARLEHALDNYFQMLWTLGLSLPVDYVEEHPFKLTGKHLRGLYRLPDRRGRDIDEIPHSSKDTVEGKLALPASGDTSPDFAVTIDGVRLYRPIRFHGYPRTQQALEGPFMFAGHAAPDMSKIPETQRGGPLSFSGYFFWTPRVLPQEHNGLLVRINGASGTLFDPTFLKYQIAERRLGQLIGEIFVDQGLEGALNIDRESFNTAHPHYQVLANWVHNALRLIRNTLKTLQSESLQKRREAHSEVSAAKLTKTVNALIRDSTDCDPREVPEVVLAATEAAVEEAVEEGKLGYLRADVIDLATEGTKAPEAWVAQYADAVARLLDAHGLLQSMDRSQQAKLIAGIVRLFAIDK
jgi:Histidine kinase-, DNA gyrase B-, and HSP90-like ATPase